MCVELFQWGDRDYAAEAVVLQREATEAMVVSRVKRATPKINGFFLRGCGSYQMLKGSGLLMDINALQCTT